MTDMEFLHRGTLLYDAARFHLAVRLAIGEFVRAMQPVVKAFNRLGKAVGL